MSNGNVGGDERENLHELSESVMIARLEDWISQQ